MRLNSHPVAFARLVDLVEGRLTAAEQDETRGHVAACARCSGQVTQLERVTKLMRTDATVDAPRDVLASAVSLFRAAGRAPSLVGRVIATLSFDSARARPAFGVRSGASPAGTRQLLFSAGANDIDLRLARGEQGWTVSGQVLGAGAGAGRVELEGVGEGSSKAEAQMSESSEFSLPPVPEGQYRLLLHLPGEDVQVPELDLRD
jgi:hypothetical protein